MGARATTTNLMLANVKSGKSRTLHEKPGLSGKEQVEEEEEGEPRVSNWASRVQRSGPEENAGSIHVLPDDMLTLIFARVPRATLSAIRLACSTWKRICQHQDIAVLRQQMGVAEGWIYVLSEKAPGTSFRVFDPRANKWSVLPPILGHSPQENWQGFACVAVGHKLILMGGRYVDTTAMLQSSGSVCGDVIVYSALTNQWTRASSMKTPRSWFAAAVIGTQVYVAGGQGKTRFLDSAEVYDSETDTWYTIPSMGNVRSSCHGAALDGQFWVIAGEYNKNQYDDGDRKGSAEVFDPLTGSWRFIPDMWLDSHKVPGPNTVIGGELVFVHLSKLMAYNKDTNTWMPVGHVSGADVYNRPFSRFGFACESVHNNLYIIGGKWESWQNRSRFCVQTLNTVEVCDLQVSKNTSRFLGWRSCASMVDGGGIIAASAVLWL
ncbi:unnamed protein product [Sphagnum jensenii]|uniref:F-box domain-containing protein n=1 Tax=Sphagnum jensenii TaxID=128206 RepID=A0ABP1A8L7_9BRYO